MCDSRHTAGRCGRAENDEKWSSVGFLHGRGRLGFIGPFTVYADNMFITDWLWRGMKDALDRSKRCGSMDKIWEL